MDGKAVKATLPVASCVKTNGRMAARKAARSAVLLVSIHGPTRASSASPKAASGQLGVLLLEAANHLAHALHQPAQHVELDALRLAAQPLQPAEQHQQQRREG